MKLIGRYMSPFVRRVGVSLHLLDIPFTNEPLSVLTDSLKIREYSPLGRVPALVLDDGRVLIDSNAILDHFDQQAGAERALLPLSGAERSEAMNLLAFAVGACEKTVAAYAIVGRKDWCGTIGTAIAKTRRVARWPCWMHARPSAASGPCWASA